MNEVTIPEVMLQLVGMPRKQLELLVERLVSDFPERADQLHFLIHTEFSEKYLGADHRVG